MKRKKYISEKNKLSGIIILLFLLSLLVFFAWRSFSQESELSPVTPTWNGIVPGQTTVKEVESILGEPERISECYAVQRFGGGNKFLVYRYLFECNLNNYITYFFPAYDIGNLNTYHEIHFANDVVFYITERVTGARENHDLKTPEKVFDYYGIPEDVTWSRGGSNNNAILYCKRGIIIQSRIRGVDEILYFTPMSLNQCYDKFWFEISRYDLYEGGDVITRKDPWGIMDE